MEKQVKLLFILIAVLFLSTATFFFLIAKKGSPTGSVISDFDTDNKSELPENCWDLKDGRIVCKLKMVSIPAGEVFESDFAFTNTD